MPYNYAKLLGRIVEVVGTQGKFANRMGLSERTISRKLNGKVGWKQAEILRPVMFSLSKRRIFRIIFLLFEFNYNELTSHTKLRR